MPVGRHRHAINVRTDGLASVLGTLVQDSAVLAALLVDVDSGMVLDACGPELAGGGNGLDQEQLGAAHGDLMRLALGPAVGAGPGAGEPPGGCEIVVSLDGGRHLVLRRVPDPYGDRLALSVLVAGPPRALRRTRRRLREVSAAALTAGPTVSLRPVAGTWVPGVTEERPAPAPRPQPMPARAGGVVTPALGIGRPGLEPVGGSALAALDAPVPSRPSGPPTAGPRPGTSRPTDTRAGAGPSALRVVPAVVGPAVEVADSQRRPAPPSALPPPAQRSQSD